MTSLPLYTQMVRCLRSLPKLVFGYTILFKSVPISFVVWQYFVDRVTSQLVRKSIPRRLFPSQRIPSCCCRRVHSVGGTSASSPVCASFTGVSISSNSSYSCTDFHKRHFPLRRFPYPARRSPTRILESSPLFFLSAFNDISNGSNPGCGINDFTATTAWDPLHLPCEMPICLRYSRILLFSRLLGWAR